RQGARRQRPGHCVPMKTDATLRAILAIAAIGSVPCAAHELCIEVACSHDAHGRLVTVMSPGADTQRLELFPGDARFTGMWIDDVPAIRALRADRAGDGACQIGSGHLIAIKRVRFGPALVVFNPVSFVSILDHDGDAFPLPIECGRDFSMNLLTGMCRPG